ncbi:PAS domain-containing protein [Mucilaginibacter glaciei]|uniref:histidine kinase n=1 Tax=Mucilaginibacter glaciei TaxID=2772109 RepID=A0A926P004_9SPHI|nr:PAS domain-containing protein [Mucilaginibacter glaciei]MBD1394804.1 PAS domain-containing protein [Mucilaginibacter glaciei]
MSTFPSNFSNELLLDILAQTNTATAIHSTDEMIIETANDAMIAIWGKDRGVIGLPIEEALPELKGQPFLGLLQNVLHTGETISGTDTRADLVVNGVLQPFYFDFEYRAIKDKDGKPICVLHTALDVTQRYLGRQRELELESELQATNEELAAANEELAAQNEEMASTNEELVATNEDLSNSRQSLLQANTSLAQSELRFRSIVDQAPVAICVLVGRNLIIEAANDTILSHWGKTKAVIGSPMAEAIPELSGQGFYGLLDYTYTTGEVYRGTEVKAVLKHEGKMIDGYYSFIYQPLKDYNGKITGLIIVSSDVTEQVLSRQKLELSTNRLNSMVMTAPIGMTVIKGRDLVVEIANKPMYDLWSRTPEQAIGNKLLDVFPELKDQPFPKMLLSVFDTGKRVSVPEIPAIISTSDGRMEEYFVDFAYDPLYDLEGNVEAILATVINITEQVKAREELQKAKDTLKQAIESADIGTWSADMATGLLTLSEQANQLHGVPEGKTITLEQAMTTVTPEYIDKVNHAMRAAIDTHESFDIEYIINPLDGSKPRWLKSTGKAYYDDEGQVITMSGTMMDITQRKEKDQQKDDFISIASHELKTPVTSLKAALQLLDKMKGNPSPVMLPKLVEQSNRSMDKISTLIEDLLNLSRMNEGQLKLEKSRFSVQELLDQCCNHVRVAGKYELITQGDEDVVVFADEHRVDQVIVNMVNNAVKYAPNSLKIILDIEKQEKAVKISVTDTGPGIPKEKQEHLFERYYRTDAAGYQNSGLGLGLYISAEIVRKHGGEIGVDSEVGKGTTFWFTLPL